MSLATKLVTLRKQKGLTQTELAERLNVSRQAISRWEVGAATPSIDSLKVLSEIYDISVDYLLNDDATDFSKNTDAFNEDGCQKSDEESRSKRNICYMPIVLALALLFAAFFVIPRLGQNEEQITPIENMVSEEEDNQSTIVFSFE